MDKQRSKAASVSFLPHHSSENNEWVQAVEHLNKMLSWLMWMKLSMQNLFLGKDKEKMNSGTDFYGASQFIFLKED